MERWERAGDRRRRVPRQGAGPVASGRAARRSAACPARDYPHLRDPPASSRSGAMSPIRRRSRAAVGAATRLPRRRQGGDLGPVRGLLTGANVTGTRNVIAACRRAGAADGLHQLAERRLQRPRYGGRRRVGSLYPSHYDAPYPATKAEAERLVLAANDATLATVALRPHLIWGPGDNNLIPRIIARAQAGRLRRIGAGRIARRLDLHRQRRRGPPARRRPARGPVRPSLAESISSPRARPSRSGIMINNILKAAHMPPVRGRSRARCAVAAAGLVEAV